MDSNCIHWHATCSIHSRHYLGYPSFGEFPLLWCHFSSFQSAFSVAYSFATHCFIQSISTSLFEVFWLCLKHSGYVYMEYYTRFQLHTVNIAQRICIFCFITNQGINAFNEVINSLVFLSKILWDFFQMCCFAWDLNWLIMCNKGCTKEWK